MPNLFTRRFNSVLLAGLLAGSALSSFAQAQTAPAKTAPKKSTAATTAKKPAAKPAPTLSTPKEKLSYALGVDFGKRLKATGTEIDPAVLSRAVSDTLAGKPAMSDNELRVTMTTFQDQLRQRQTAKIKEMSDKNKTEGDAFLAANKTKEGVVALPSGLQYKVLTAGQGPKPTAADTVVCNYRGTLINGKEFDSSYKRNEPASFPVTGVIKGWTEALQLMPTGSKWQLFIPPDLAYGERGAGADIEPNSTLVFEVELLSIQPKGAEPDKK